MFQALLRLYKTNPKRIHITQNRKVNNDDFPVLVSDFHSQQSRDNMEKTRVLTETNLPYLVDAWRSIDTLLWDV